VSRRARVAALAAAVGIVLVLGVVAWRLWGPPGRLGNPGLRSDGPMQAPYAHGWSATKPVGHVFTDGFETLRTTGDDVAVIESVELVGSRGIEMVGALIAPPPRRYAAEVSIDSWPPVLKKLFDEETLVPAVGAEIGSDKQGWELLVGLKAVEEGVVFRKGIRVTYTADGDRYEVVLPAELTICTSRDHEVEGHCPFADE
jgi:hypothetical protein